MIATRAPEDGPSSSSLPPLGIISLVIIIVWWNAFQAIGAFDTWWHIATGRYIVETGTIPSTDPFTWSRLGEAWTPHSWLPGLATYLLVSAAGLHALVIAMPLLMSLTVGALTLSLRQQLGGDGIAAVCAIILFFFPSRIVWLQRPNILSLIFLIAIIVLLESSWPRTKPFRFIALITTIMVLWANSHAGFVIGLVTLVIYLLFPPSPTSYEYRRTVCTSIVAAAAVGFVTPFGAGVYRYALEVQSFSLTLINEWQSPNFHAFWIFPPIVGLLMILVGVSPKPLPKRHVFLTAFWLAMFLRSVRHLPFFCLSSALLAGYALSHWTKNWHPSSKWGRAFRGVFDREHPGTILGVCILLTLWSVVGMAQPSILPQLPERLVAEERFPSLTILHAVEELPTDARLFNDYGVGGYLIWHVPNVPVFIDGRADVFGLAMLKEYSAFVKVGDDWDEIAEKWKFTHYLVKRSSRLKRHLMQQGHSILAEDKVMVLFETMP